MKKTWMGKEVSEYGIENGYVDYACLASCFDAVLCNNMANRIGETMELENGIEYDEENDYYPDIYQYYIIDQAGYNLLVEYTDEIVYYDTELDVYVWGVTHYGTSWKYVLTDIKLGE